MPCAGLGVVADRGYWLCGDGVVVVVYVARHEPGGAGLPLTTYVMQCATVSHMVWMMTVAEAASQTGIPTRRLTRACRNGELIAEKIRLGTLSHGWVIQPESLQEYAAANPPRPTGKPWTEADDAALIELQHTCSDQQVADYLGRTHSSVATRLNDLRSEGRVGRRGSRGSAVRLPWVIPRSAVVVAKTCPQCGKFRDASQFSSGTATNNNRQVIATNCRHCENARRKEAGYSKKPNKQKALRKALQAASIDLSDRSKSWTEYTQAELELVGDISRSEFEVAIELKRTYYAICSKRTLMGVRPRRPRFPASQWLIHFPNAMKALQEHYRELGVVPESEWDWNEVA